MFIFRNPLEVSEEFAQEYNNAKDFDEKERLEQTAQKMLERAKVKTYVADFLSEWYVYISVPTKFEDLAKELPYIIFYQMNSIIVNFIQD